MLEAASVSRVADPNAAKARARSGEFASQLRAAALEGDDVRITRLVSELLRCKGLSRGQRIALQQKALMNLVRSLRSATLSDDVTGLPNARGFVQTATRLLDLAARDGQTAHLVYFGIDQFERIEQTLGSTASEISIRQTGNLLRDMFPSYGVYEVLGRLAVDEFAALTTSDQYAGRDTVMLRVCRPQRSTALPTLNLSVGLAHFNPDRPVPIDELLESAKRSMNEPLSQIASTGGVPARHGHSSPVLQG
jgi:diguanylate cyclase (GGDEF)-like protein